MPDIGEERGIDLEGQRERQKDLEVRENELWKSVVKNKGC